MYTTKLRRFGNYLIDMIIFRMLLFPVAFFIGYIVAVCGLAGPVFWELIDSPITGWLLTISIFFLYYFAFEVIWQRTPGKFITGTKVVTPDGRKPATYAIAVRTLARLVPFEPFSFLGKEANGWHDKWSCTTIVRAKRIEQNLTETSLTTNPDEQSLGITALLEKEYGNEWPEKEAVAQAKAVAENSEEEKQGVMAEQIGTVKVACREEEICDVVTHSQTTTDVDEQGKWLLLALLVVVSVAIIAARFSNIPTDTRASVQNDGSQRGIPLRLQGGPGIIDAMSTSGNPFVMIEGEILYEGDVVRGFKIRKIFNHRVEFEKDGQVLVREID